MKSNLDSSNYVLPERLKAALLERSLSVRELSGLSGVSFQTIHNWLSGQRPRDIVSVFKVSNALGMSIDELAFGTKPNGIQSVMADEDTEVVLVRVPRSELFELMKTGERDLNP